MVSGGIEWAMGASMRESKIDRRGQRWDRGGERRRGIKEKIREGKNKGKIKKGERGAGKFRTPRPPNEGKIFFEKGE